jgi:preprotein translocase subunit Sec61beta
MLRNFIGLIAGVLLHYLLLIACSRLAWLLIVGNVDRTHIEYKDGVIRWMLWRTFAIDPAVAVVVGVFVACVVRRSYWWLGGIAVLPLLIYGDIRADDRIEIGTSVVYVAFAFAAAFVVSRFKQMHTA